MSRRSTATRTDGRKERKINLGRDAGGRRIRRSVYGQTDKELDQKARELIRAYEDGTLTRPRAGTVTIADLAEMFAEHLTARVVAGTPLPTPGTGTCGCSACTWSSRTAASGWSTCGPRMSSAG